MEGKILTEKQLLRRQFLKERAGLLKEARELADRSIGEKLISLSEFVAAENIFLYAAYGAEADTGIISQTALAEGKNIFYPRVLSDGVMRFYKVTEPDTDLVEGYRGIREPREECILSDIEPDIVVVPGVAFDRAFHRMGYGKGFYDRYFANMTAGIKKIALCHALMLKDEIPYEKHDALMDMIITENEIWKRENYSLNI